MKILSLRFENLNALYGRWAIDFTHPDYEAEGIFAITGPTGSGKTTLLDAICLALYGRTPRLARINRSGNEIMSRQRSHCFAEVVFETQAGRFLCHWSQHRARYQLEGELQAPKHELSNACTGVILDTGPRAVAPAVEALTGLDYERFTRSVLLAQGGFAAFLHAGPDERAPLLEQITGTEIYARLSVTVHEQTRLMRLQRDERERLFASIEVFSAEQEQQLREEEQALQPQLHQLEAEIEQTTAAIRWREGLQKLKTELALAEHQLQQAQQAQRDFSETQQRLDWARQCAEFEPLYVRWHAANEQEERYAQQERDVQTQLPLLRQQWKETQALAQQFQQEYEQAQKDHVERQQLWQTVQRFDERLAGIQQWLDEAEKSCQRRQTQVHSTATAYAQAKHLLMAQQRQYEAALQYQHEYQADAWLEQGLEALLAQLAQRDEQQALLQGQQNLLKQYQEETQRGLQEQQAEYAQQKKQQAQIKQLQQQRTELQRQRNEVLASQSPTYWQTLLAEVQEQVFLRRLVADMEEQRQHLQSDQPCPLCGSKEHPYVQEGLPAAEQYEEKQAAIQRRLAQADRLEQRLVSLEQQWQKQQESVHQGEQQLLDLKYQVAQSQERQQIALQQKQQIQQRLAQLEQLINQQLERFDWQLTTDALSDSLVPKLRARYQAWRDNQAQLQQLHQQRVQQQAECQRIEQLLSSYQDELATNIAEREKWQQEHATLQAQRRALFGDQDPQEEQQRSQTLSQQLEQQYQQHRQAALQAERAYTQQRTKAQTVAAQQAEQQQRSLVARQQLETAIQAAGFTDVAAFEQRRLPAAERQRLEAQSTSLQQALLQAQATCHERRQRLALEREQKLTGLDLEALVAQLKKQRQQYTELQTRTGQLGHQLAANERAKKQRQTHYQAVQQQTQEYRKWQDLHALIGSADGKKYRNFVQGLSFAQLVYYANQQMHTMSDRYLLIPGGQPLSLDVVDNYQAGEIRSTQNLSGGESFIVSLALALGLSKMASQNVRLDSLFLDEGFGTLDDEALGLALDTLASLRQESKLIGVISHVPALKERISTQIQVRSSRRGQSRLQGPGCRQE